MKKTTTISPAVHAANDLTAQWCGRLGGEDFVASGAGLWPLLALLASAADETARAELVSAIGRPVESARQDALELIDVLRAGESTTAALGLWACKDIPLHEEWVSHLPSGVVGTLTDQEALDQWASRETDGLIKKFPLDLTPATAIVLASALAAKVKWCKPFDSHPRRGQVSRDDPGPPAEQWLNRVTYNLADAAVLDGAVTRVVIAGDGDVDVHLVLGDSQPADALAAGLRELSGKAQVRPAAELDGGPGFAVHHRESSRPDDMLHVKLPSFEIAVRHDLMKQADLFGLHAVSDRITSHLPLLSPAPLYVSKGAQSVLARFFAEGFEAAAVTAFGIAVTGAPPEDRYTITYVDVDFDRPFGFIAVHRPSRLAVVAGWVNSPFREGSQG